MMSIAHWTGSRRAGGFDFEENVEGYLVAETVGGTAVLEVATGWTWRCVGCEIDMSAASGPFGPSLLKARAYGLLNRD
jgi:hypothetical protein